MKELQKVSRWITIKHKDITSRHSLFYYSDTDEYNTTQRGYLTYFKWNNQEYALNQFINRFSMYGFDFECKEYPSFICGYDGDGNIFNPLLLEMDEYGEKVRLWVVA